MDARMKMHTDTFGFHLRRQGFHGRCRQFLVAPIEWKPGEDLEGVVATLWRVANSWWHLLIGNKKQWAERSTGLTWSPILGGGY